MVSDLSNECLAVLDLLSVDRDDAVSLLEACVLGIFTCDLSDVYAGSFEVVVFCIGFRYILDRDSDNRSGSDFAVFDEIIDDVRNGIDRDREGKSFDTDSGALGIYDSDELASAVEEAASGVSAVDGCICLHQSHRSALDGQSPVKSADDT